MFLRSTQFCWRDLFLSDTFRAALQQQGAAKKVPKVWVGLKTPSFAFTFFCPPADYRFPISLSSSLGGCEEARKTQGDNEVGKPDAISPRSHKNKMTTIQLLYFSAIRRKNPYSVPNNLLNCLRTSSCRQSTVDEYLNINLCITYLAPECVGERQGQIWHNCIHLYSYLWACLKALLIESLPV